LGDRHARWGQVSGGFGLQGSANGPAKLSVLTDDFQRPPSDAEPVYCFSSYPNVSDLKKLYGGARTEAQAEARALGVGCAGVGDRCERHVRCPGTP
jgi:hypothetical protein